MSLGSFVMNCVRRPRYLPRRLTWAIHQYLPERPLTMATRLGQMTFSSRDLVIGRLLCLREDYGSETLDLAMTILRGERPAATRGILLDVGANVGTVCVPLLLRHPFGHALVFEPDPYNLALLERNVDQNGLRHRVEIHRTALSSANGEAELFLSPVNYGDHRLNMRDDGSGAAGRRRVIVRTRRLDDVLTDRNFPPAAVGLVWMDVQAHEPAVLRGATSLLAARVPLIMEFWPSGLRPAGEDPRAMLGLLAAHYSAWYDLAEPGAAGRSVEELGSVLDRLDRHGGRGWADLLLL